MLVTFTQLCDWVTFNCGHCVSCFNLGRYGPLQASPSPASSAGFPVVEDTPLLLHQLGVLSRMFVASAIALLCAARLAAVQAHVTLRYPPPRLQNGAQHS